MLAMPTQIITATFANGQTVTRRTGAAYTHAVKRSSPNRAGAGPRVSFHTSEEAAREIAGRRGEVVRTDYVAGAAPAAPPDPRVIEAKKAAYEARREFGRNDPRSIAAVEEWRRMAGIDEV